MSFGNAGEDASIDYMEYYDALPRPIRDALKHTAVPMSARQCYEYIQEHLPTYGVDTTLLGLIMSIEASQISILEKDGNTLELAEMLRS